MSVTITANVVSTLSVVETDSNASPTDNTITYDQLSELAGYTAATDVPVTKDVPFTKALSSGTATIDLTNLTHSNGATIDGTGLKVRACKFRNPAANANAITLTFGASTPYLLFGSAWKITLQPGQSFGPCLLLSGAPTISGSLKNIDLAGTLSQSLECHLVLG